MCVIACCMSPKKPYRTPWLALFSLSLVLGCSKIMLRHPSAATLAARQGSTWQTTRSTHFVLYFEEGTPAERQLKQLEEDAEAARDRVLMLLGETEYEPRVSIFAVSTREKMKKLVGWGPNGTAFYRSQVLCHLVNEQGTFPVTHELFHVIAMNLWGVPKRWINEGFAVYAAGLWQGLELHQLARHLLDTGRLLPIDRLAAGFGTHPKVAYPQAGSFIKFLYEEYGREKIRQFWARGAVSFRRVYGNSLAGLEREWLVTVRQADSRGIQYDTESGQ